MSIWPFVAGRNNSRDGLVTERVLAADQPVAARQVLRFAQGSQIFFR